MNEHKTPFDSRFRIKIFKRIEEILPSQWDTFFPNILEDHSFFKALDESCFDQFSFYYILVYKNDAPIAAASCFIMDFPLDISVTGPFKTMTNGIKKLMPGLINPKVVVCGLPMGAGRIGVISPSYEAIEKINEGIEVIAKENRASLIFYKDFSASYEEFLKPILKEGYTRIESLPNTEMEINFNNFDEYLKTLSPSSREGLKRNFKKVDNKVKFSLEMVNALDETILPQVYGLYLQTFDNHELGFEKLPMEFFRKIAQNMPNETKFFLWRVDGKLVTFALCLVRGDYFIDYYLGFDYSLNNQYYLYFIRFRDLLKWCVEHGIQRYEMGQTSYEAKRRLGFKFIRYFVYIKHRNKVLNFILKPFIQLMKPENFDPVFKLIDKNN